MNKKLISKGVGGYSLSKFVKLIALLMVLMLAVSGLSACKKKAAEQPAEAGGEVVTEESSDETATEESQPADETATEAADEADDEAAADSSDKLDEAGFYYSKDDVALYLHTYGHLPDNFMTKKEAKKLGWSGGSLEKFAPGMAIGGDKFGNYEGSLPDDNDQQYYECDIDTLGKKKRGAKRIVWSDDGYIYYTDDHYESFELLYEGN